MAVTPVVLALSASGAEVARRVAEALAVPLHGRADRVEAAVSFDDTLAHIRALFAAGVPVIGVCAAGILIRAVAPLVSDKRSEPALVAVAEDGSAVVPLLGGHRGANDLARRIGEELATAPAVTTAGDLAFGVALDSPPEGWVLGTPDLARDTAARLLAGTHVRLDGGEAAKAGWLAALPSGGDLPIAATMAPPGPGVLTYHPQRATLGVGCARNCPPEELAGLVRSVLDEAELAPAALKGVFTLDLKADEPAVLDLARALDLPLRLFEASELEAEAGRLETPSDIVFAEVGCHGVAEGAALAGAGPDGALWYAKRKTANATCALALAPGPVLELRGRGRGRVSVVGIGPGQAAWRTPDVSKLVAEADELVGYGLYIDLLGPLAAGKPRADFPLGGEEARCRHALERAGEGVDVALICSGDAGIYAMAALVHELLDRPVEAGGVSDGARRAEVIVAPGISALQAAAARVGAPLGHDFCAISLSDLLTPRAAILKRLKAAAEGDFVVAFYNPVSQRRRVLLAEAREILLAHRPAGTPVVLARSLGRPDESIRHRTLAGLEVDEVDMMTVVLVGASGTRSYAAGEGLRVYTPRGYAKKMDHA